MIEPYSPYKQLRDLFDFAVAQGADHTRYLSGQYLADLVTWYHLVWTGETVRRAHEPVVRLMSQGEGFSYAQRMEVFQLIATVLREILGRYRALAESGRVELSSTPHTHPIGPLLLDFACAREAMPEAPLPEAQCYPAAARAWAGTSAREEVTAALRRAGGAGGGGAVSCPSRA
jgi:alpha-amylase/alpha-mannosidase (GH57 family)